MGFVVKSQLSAWMNFVAECTEDRKKVPTAECAARTIGKDLQLRAHIITVVIL